MCVYSLCSPSFLWQFFPSSVFLCGYSVFIYEPLYRCPVFPNRVSSIDSSCLALVCFWFFFLLFLIDLYFAFVAFCLSFLLLLCLLSFVTLLVFLSLLVFVLQLCLIKLAFCSSFCCLHLGPHQISTAISVSGLVYCRYNS